MKKLAFLIVLALELAVAGCGTSTTNNTNATTTSTSGNWEAQLTGGADQASLLNFVTAFSVTNSGPITISSFSFINAGKCFGNGVNGSRQSGSANLITGSADQVTGTLTYTITSVTPAGNTLTLNGNLTGTSNSSTSSAGTLSNGVVTGTWTLSGGAGDPTCSVSNPQPFVMCQGSNTCTIP